MIPESMAETDVHFPAVDQFELQTAEGCFIDRFETFGFTRAEVTLNSGCVLNVSDLVKKLADESGFGLTNDQINQMAKEVAGDYPTIEVESGKVIVGPYGLDVYGNPTATGPVLEFKLNLTGTEIELSSGFDVSEEDLKKAIDELGDDRSGTEAFPTSLPADTATDVPPIPTTPVAGATASEPEKPDPGDLSKLLGTGCLVGGSAVMAYLLGAALISRKSGFVQEKGDDPLAKNIENGEMVESIKYELKHRGLVNKGKLTRQQAVDTAAFLEEKILRIRRQRAIHGEHSDISSDIEKIRKELRKFK